jgi:polyphosphate kinase 2 (PPK2 family)
VCAFEGADAAGKGGAIRRIAASMDARDYQIIPVAAPTEEERAQPYLWRFWRHMPRLGRVAIFDRTWYGRVLVERVEGFCAEADWLRAYTEINDFEHDLAEAGVIVVKFWLQISQEEQLKRFKEREKIEFKRFKITEEDWRNREKVGCLPGGHLRHGRPHQYRHRAMDPGRGQRQGLRPRESAAHHLRASRGRA